LIKRILIPTAIAIFALVITACEPAVKAPPVPDRVAMAGDSILWQAALYGGDLHGADLDGKLYPGWEFRQPLPRVIQDVAGAETSPDVLVIALGQNARDVYGSIEWSELTSLAFSPHDDACVVLVKPHIGSSNPTYVDNLTRVRNDMQSIANSRPNTPIVDVTDLYTAHPEHLAADGVHLNVPANWNDWILNPISIPAAIDYANLIWSGVEQCG